jgi:hypothetical protein
VVERAAARTSYRPNMSPATQDVERKECREYKRRAMRTH